CASGDGCCPAGCDSLNDGDCRPRCGNGVVEAGETCDGTCPASCPDIGCQKRHLEGSASACTAACVNANVIATCTNGDGCCPSSCTSVNDNDCPCSCGNSITESACGETCDGNCPASCPPIGCQLQTMQGKVSTCNAQCVNAGTQTACNNND